MPPPDDDQLKAAAVLEELQSGRNLMNGVIPDFAAPQADRTSFAFGCCQYPGGFLDQAVAYASYRDLEKRLAAGNGPRFVVLTGDQVYTDATAGILDPSIRDGRYILPYNRWLQARAVRTSLRQVPSFMVLDDHEIENDWEGPNTDPPYDDAIRSYKRYQCHQVPDTTRLYFDFMYDQFRFFMLDTRTRRQQRSPETVDFADMLDFQGSGNQWSDLETWIQQTPHDRPKFIVSPSMLLPRHRDAARWGHRSSALHSDGWDGFPASLHRILALAATSSTAPVVFLNGDEHVGCLATITVRYVVSGTPTEKTMYSIHTPGLYTPYSFINGSAANWMPETDHEFEVGGQTFEYTVTYTPFEGEGFAYLNVDRTAGAWKLTCQFADGPVHTVL